MDNERSEPRNGWSQFAANFRTDGTSGTDFPKDFAPKMNRFDTEGKKKTIRAKREGSKKMDNGQWTIDNEEPRGALAAYCSPLTAYGLL
jgi:hypothetical protein